MLKQLLLAVVLAFGFSCATAGEGDDDVGGTADSAIQNPDAPINQFADARMSFPDASFPADAPSNPIPDASLPPDAMIPSGADAANGITCVDNDGCTTPGTCCFLAFCVPGTPDPIFQCLPD